MDKILFEQLHASGLISDQALKAICDKEANRQVSVHWDLRILLYLGVLLVSAGLGILLYKHIDTIGHAILLAIAALAAAGCFTYCFLRALPYSAGRVAPPNVWFDYVLLLGVPAATHLYGLPTVSVSGVWQPVGPCHLYANAAVVCTGILLRSPGRAQPCHHQSGRMDGRCDRAHAAYAHRLEWKQYGCKRAHTGLHTTPGLLAGFAI